MGYNRKTNTYIVKIYINKNKWLQLLVLKYHYPGIYASYIFIDSINNSSFMMKPDSDLRFCKVVGQNVDMLWWIAYE